MICVFVHSNELHSVNTNCIKKIHEKYVLLLIEGIMQSLLRNTKLVLTRLNKGRQYCHCKHGLRKQLRKSNRTISSCLRLVFN